MSPETMLDTLRRSTAPVPSSPQTREARERRMLLPICVAAFLLGTWAKPSDAHARHLPPGGPLAVYAMVWCPPVLGMQGVSVWWHSLPAATPLQLRSALLYSDREFSTFIRHSIVTSAARSETAAAPPPLERRTEDRWIAMDKAKHLTFSFLWTLGTQYVVVNKGLTSEQRGLPISITSGALVGVAKEVYDLRSGPTNTFSYRDLAVDAVGILLAAGVILL